MLKILFTLFGFLFSNFVSGEVEIVIKGDKRCFISNGMPNHNTGSFPNSGNPHTIKQQNVNMCITTNPIKTNRPQKVRGSIAIAINGVQIRPGTADYYDESSKRGFSRDSSSGWNLEGLGARDKLGMDFNNAHVDNRGLYHYHGVAGDLVDYATTNLIAYAADGFEIHYAKNLQTSGYKLKQGNRATAPHGKHDGTYNEDWEYVAGSGSLDECNGGFLGDKFVYFATDNYPFFPRCVWGNPSEDFLHKKSGNQNSSNNFNNFNNFDNQRSQNNQRNNNFSKQNNRRQKPPQEALNSCKSKNNGEQCSFTVNNHKISGICRMTPRRHLICAPRR
jgi:hypothetical protein